MAIGGGRGPLESRHFEPHGPCGGLARISKQLPLDAGAAAVAGRWVGKWPPGALGLFLDVSSVH